MQKIILAITCFLSVGPLLKSTAQTYTLSGTYKSTSSANCSCSNLGSITFDYNDRKASYPFCLDNVNGSLSEGQNIVVRGTRVSGRCDNGDMFEPTQFYNSTDLVTGVFKKGNFQCPLQNEGKLQLEDGTSIDVSSSVALVDGQRVSVTNAAWGLKFCNGKLFNIYFIKGISGSGSSYSSSSSSPASSANSSRSAKPMTGYFDSKKGTKHELSLIGYNIGDFNEMQKGGGSHVVCFDRLAGGQNLNISSNPIVIEGYFEETTQAEPDPGMQTLQNVVGPDGKVYSSRVTRNVFYVTKWRYY